MRNIDETLIQVCLLGRRSRCKVTLERGHLGQEEEGKPLAFSINLAN